MTNGNCLWEADCYTFRQEWFGQLIKAWVHTSEIKEQTFTEPKIMWKLNQIFIRWKTKQGDELLTFKLPVASIDRVQGSTLLHPEGGHHTPSSGQNFEPTWRCKVCHKLEWHWDLILFSRPSKEIELHLFQVNVELIYSFEWQIYILLILLSVQHFTVMTYDTCVLCFFLLKMWRIKKKIQKYCLMYTLPFFVSA